ERVLPAEPLADLSHGVEVEGAAEIPCAVEIGIESQPLVEHRALAQLVDQFFSERKSCQVARERVIRLVGVVQARQQIQRSSVVLDGMVAGAASEDRAQVEGLQRVGEEVGSGITKQ